MAVTSSNSNEADLRTFSATPDETAVATLLDVFCMATLVLGDYVTKAMKSRYGEKRWSQEVAEDVGPKMRSRFLKCPVVLCRDIYLVTELLLNRLDSVFIDGAADIDRVENRGLRLQRLASEVDCVESTRNALFHGIRPSVQEVERCLLCLERLMRRFGLEMQKVTASSIEGFHEYLQVIEHLKRVSLPYFVCNVNPLLRTPPACQACPIQQPSSPASAVPPSSLYLTTEENTELQVSAITFSSSQVAKVLVLRVFGYLEFEVSDFGKNSNAKGRRENDSHTDISSLVKNCPKCREDENKTCAHTKRILGVSSALKIIKEFRNRLAHGEHIQPRESRTLLVSLLKCFSSTSQRSLADDEDSLDHKLSTAVKLFDSNHLARGKAWSDSRFSISLVFSSTSSKQDYVSRDLCSRPRPLIGREKIVQQIKSLLLSSRDSGQSCRLLLHGPHGIGKTSVMREVAAQLRSTFTVQHTFQATTEQALLADISFFLSCNGQTSTNKSTFKEYIHQSTSCLLLMFDDIQQPDIVMSLLENSKHCVVFTSVCQLAWIEQKFVPNVVTPISLGALSTSESLSLFEQVLRERGCGKTSAGNFYNGMNKEAVCQLLRDRLLNIPLAVRLAAHLVASGRLLNDDLNVFEMENSSERSLFDQKAAKVVHVRGFYHVVRIALKLICSKRSALTICLALSVLSPNGVPFWFVELVGYHLGLSLTDTVQACQRLVEAGLATLAHGDGNVVMHEIVQCHVRQELSACGAEEGEVYLLPWGELREAVSSSLTAVFMKKTLGFSTTTTKEIHELIHDFLSGSSSRESSYLAYLETFQTTETVSKLRDAISTFLQYANFICLDWQRQATCLKCLAWCCFRQDDKFHGIFAEVSASAIQAEQPCKGKLSPRENGCVNIYSAVSDWHTLSPSDIIRRALTFKRNSFSPMATSQVLCHAMFMLHNQSEFDLAQVISRELADVTMTIFGEFTSLNSLASIELETLINAAQLQLYCGDWLNADRTTCLLLSAWLPIREECPIEFYSSVPIVLSDLAESEECHHDMAQRAMLLRDTAFSILLLIWDMYPFPARAIKICRRSLSALRARAQTVLTLPVPQSVRDIFSVECSALVVAWMRRAMFVASSSMLVRKEIHQVWKCLSVAFNCAPACSPEVMIFLSHCWKTLLKQFWDSQEALLCSTTVSWVSRMRQANRFNWKEVDVRDLSRHMSSSNVESGLRRACSLISCVWKGVQDLTREELSEFVAAILAPILLKEQNELGPIVGSGDNMVEQQLPKLHFDQVSMEEVFNDLVKSFNEDGRHHIAVIISRLLHFGLSKT